MYVKKFPGDLNPDPYPSYPTSTHIYRVTIASRRAMIGSNKSLILFLINIKICQWSLNSYLFVYLLLINP